MACPGNVRLKPSLAIICSLMTGLARHREYRHSRAEGGPAPEYVEIREEINHHCEMEPELRALGYAYGWLQKRWRVWHDRRYVHALSPDLHEEDQPAEKPSTPIPAKGGHRPRAANLGDFMGVA